MSCAELLLSQFADISAHWWLPPIAVALDRIIGDPPRFPHPVRCIGSFLSRLEPVARKWFRVDFIAGFISVTIALTIAWGTARGVLALPSFIGLGAALYLSFAGLALGQLLREGRNAAALLGTDDIPAARCAVGFLVSRDVSGADKEELCRVLAESLSENLNDAFVAPLFWLVFTGPVGLWLYKAASTMDSMWGYPHAPWTKFGTAAARLDDVLAYLPARLTALFLLFTARYLPDMGSRPSIGDIRNDARKMKSPNAGWPMAACARIHGATMGGRAVYAGKSVDKPILGPAAMPWTTKHIQRLIRHLEISAFLAAAALWTSGFTLHLFLW